MLRCDGYVKAEATNNEARCIISIEESVSTLTSKRNIEMNKIVFQLHVTEGEIQLRFHHSGRTH